MQATLAVALTAAVLLGVLVGLSPHRGWLAVPVTAAVAGLGSLASDAQRWHPPGPLFLVFAVAATASVPSTPSDLPTAAAVSAGAALVAVAVGAVGLVWPRSPRRVVPPPARAPGVGRHVARNAVAVLLAGSLATGIGVGHPYWAMVSAVVPLAAHHIGPQIVRGVQRVVGTTAGLALAAALLAVEVGTLGVVLVVVVLQVGAELLVGRNYALALVLITPLALLMVHLAAPVTAHVLVVDRWVETLIGAVVGVGVGLATRDRAQIS